MDKRFCFPWLNTHPVLTRFRGLREYREFMHAKMEEEVKAFYRGSYQKPILGDSGFVQWVREKLGDRVKVEQDKPESRRVFGLEIGEVVRATAKVYSKAVEELKRKRRGEENEARSMAMYLSRVLGGHKHSEIGKVLGLEKTSSVSSACLRMKQRVESDRRMGRRARQIEQILLKSQERI